MRIRLRALTTLAALAAAGLLAASASAQPFGTSQDVQYAQELWRVMKKAQLVGDDGLKMTPYEGTHPHGAVLENFERDITVKGHTGVALVKKNYVGEDLTLSQVSNDRGSYLDSVTVMFRREAGYDSDNANWFWVKYNPDGSVQKNPKDMALAGRVAKGADKGCIACHTGAPGNDFVYSHDRF